MRILLIYQHFLEKNGAGISRFNEFVRFWSAMGHEITVVCGMTQYLSGSKPEKYRNRWMAREHDGTCSIVRVFVPDRYNKNFAARMWAYLLFALSSMAALLTLPRHDVVVASSPPLHVALPGLCAARLWNVPLVFEVRDIWPESAIELGVLTNKALIRISFWLERFVYRNASRICVLTPAFREALISRKGVPPEKIALIPNGVDEHLLVQTVPRDEMRERLGLQNRCVVLYIGAHGVANNLGQVLDAARLLEKRDPAITFLLVGSGMQKQSLVERARRQGIHNVRFLDPVPREEIANYIHASDIGLAVLRKLDIFKTVYPNKVFDYMACKLPVVLGIDGAARELVEEAGAGLFARPEDPQALADAVRTLASSAELRRRCGERGQAFALSRFSRRELAGAYHDLLLAASASGQSPGQKSRAAVRA